MCFLRKKNSDNEKKNYLHDKFFVSNQNFTTEHDRIVQNFSNSRFLCYLLVWDLKKYCGFNQKYVVKFQNGCHTF